MLLLAKAPAGQHNVVYNNHQTSIIDTTSERDPSRWNQLRTLRGTRLASALRVWSYMSGASHGYTTYRAQEAAAAPALSVHFMISHNKKSHRPRTNAGTKNSEVEHNAGCLSTNFMTACC